MMHARQSTTQAIPASNTNMTRGIHKLPEELLIEILRYALAPSRTITVAEGSFSRRRRRWIAEVERLKTSRSKPLPKPEPPPDALLSCRAMYKCGMQAFFNINTLSFVKPAALHDFVDGSTTLIKQNVRSVKLFHGFEASQHGCLLGPETSFALLASFPNLRYLDISTNVFVDCSDFQPLLDLLYGSMSRHQPTHVRHRADARLGPLYIRDVALKTIPKTIRDKLKSLKVRLPTLNAQVLANAFAMYDAGASTYIPRPEATELEILPYVRDFCLDAWATSPFPHDTPNIEQQCINDLWMEARAEVHFNQVAVKYGSAPPQWSTWSMEWIFSGGQERLEDYYALDKFWSEALAPRRFEDLLEVGVDGEIKAKATT